MRIQINTKKSYLASKFTCFVGLLFWLSTAADAQSFTFDWVKCASSASLGFNEPSVLASDIGDNIVSAGTFTSSSVFKIGDSTYRSFGDEDVYLIKYNGSGDVIWAKTIGGKSKDNVYKIATDTVGNIYITGTFSSDSLFFDSHYLTKKGTSDGFLIKYDSSGKFIWGKTIGESNARVIGYSVFISKKNRVYLCGGFGNTNILKVGSYTLNNNGSDDMFVVEYDEDGNVLWAKSEGGIGFEFGKDLFVNESGIYITGRFSSANIQFGSNVYNNLGSYDIFLIKYDLNGNLLWAVTEGGKSNDWSNAIVVDRFGNVYITGEFQDSASFGNITLISNGSIDIFLAKYDSDGKLLWIKNEGSKGVDRSYDLVIDSSGSNIFIVGVFPYYSSIKLDKVEILADSVNFNIDSYYQNGHIIKYDNIGNNLWGQSVFGFANSGTVRNNNIVINSKNDIYCSGSTLGPKVAFRNLILNNKGGAFLTKLKPCGSPTYGITQVTACDKYISPSGSYTWSVSGSYNDTIMNFEGCDSILTISLTINHSNATITQTETTSCNRYISPSGNHTWTSSGIYKDTLMNVMGCDSIVEIHLTLLRNTQDTINITSCESYTSPSGKYIWNSSASYLKDTIPNSVGCDSILTINLIITNNSESTINVEECYAYTSPSGRYVWTESGTYTDTIPNSAGCDSFITLHLDVKKIDVSVLIENKTLRANADWLDYQWLDCNNDYAPIPGANNRSYTPVANGSYAVEITDGDCVDTSLCYEVEVTSINDQLSSINRIQLYPNPSSGYIMLNMDIQGGKQIQVFDVLSKRVFDVHTNQNHYQFDLHSLSDGIYLMRISNNEGNVEKKFILKR